MKKVLSIVLVIALIGAFAACGGTADKDNSGDDAKATLKIGVQTNTTGDIYVSEEDVTVERYEKGAEAVVALLQNKIDAVVIDNEPAKVFVSQNTGLKILETEYAVEDYAIAIGKNNKELYNKVNNALKELIADGTVEKIVNKYIKD